MSLSNSYVTLCQYLECTDWSLDIQHVTVSTCGCKPVAVLLLEHGVFPASPTKTKTGLAIDLLDLYRTLFERSCDAITALAAALHTLYERRGFRVLSGQVCV
jgi:hypothetical protein